MSDPFLNTPRGYLPPAGSTAPVRSEYKPTFFDRNGPEAGVLLHGLSYGLMVFGLCIPMFALVNEKAHVVGGLWAVPWVLACSTIAAALTSMGGIAFVNAMGNTWKRLTIDGTSTPYKEQYSYQQALVMQGRLDDALESFEAVIAEKTDAVDPRVKAAELYARDKGNHRRAA